jgi:hypothetical protein
MMFMAPMMPLSPHQLRQFQMGQYPPIMVPQQQTALPQSTAATTPITDDPEALVDEIRAQLQSGDKRLMSKIRSWLKKPEHPERPSENESSER